ncbi:family domain-containing protein [Cyclospora cayetanensis]|uniref:Family domain-containing protein n=1 Tax=Cyclospora cayetanensis TaxID=88456 RepID=A0A1D3D111_9EIME|nr:family domain-containing protein [Cyclospora cayetanensis]
MFGGGGWKGFGEYLEAKSRKLHQQLRASLASGAGGEVSWWNKYTNSRSCLFSSLTFFVDGLQRLEGSELVSTGYPNATEKTAFACSSEAVVGHTPLREAVIEAVQLKRCLVAQGGKISLALGKGVTHVLADNVALGNQRWRKLRLPASTKSLYASQSSVDTSQSLV